MSKQLLLFFKKVFFLFIHILKNIYKYTIGYKILCFFIDDIYFMLEIFKWKINLDERKSRERDLGEKKC